MCLVNYWFRLLLYLGGMLFQKQLNVNVHIKNIRMKYSDNSCFTSTSETEE